MMRDKTVVITGATSGLGEAAALNLAAQGARIVLVARDKARADATLATLKITAPALDHKVHIANFSSIKDMKRAGAEIAAQEPRVDVLFNNAGGILNKRTVTPDGLEMTFAINHMAYFMLTSALLPNLTRTPGARIINTASSSHHIVKKLDFDDLTTARKNLFYAYGVSKLCNILYTRELARRLAGVGIVANCFCPGFVASRFGSGMGWLSPLVQLGKSVAAVSTEEGADTGVWLASSAEAATLTGGHYMKRQRAPITPAAQSDANAAKLWELSEAIAARG